MTWSERIALCAWAIAAGIVILGAVSVSHGGSVNAPFADEWLNAYPADYLPRLFERQFGHPLVIGRLALALDYWLFDAQGWSLRYGQFVLLGLAVACVWKLGALAGLESLFARGSLAGFAAVILFNPQLAQNFTWGFQFTFTLAFVAVIGAATCFADYAASGRRRSLAGGFILAAIAVLALGNGLAAPLLMTLMAWRLGLPRRVLIGLALLSVVSLALILAMPPETTSLALVASMHGLDSAPIDPPRVLAFGLRVIGSAPANTLSGFTQTIGVEIDPKLWALALGILLGVGAAALGLPTLLDRKPNPARTAAAILAIFAGASALMTGFLRGSIMPEELALSSRYTLISALLLVAIAVMTAARLKPVRQPLASAVSIAGALLALIVPLGGRPLTNDFVAFQQQNTRAQAAVVAGVEMDAGFGFLGGIVTSPPLVQSVISHLRADRSWMFADPWAHRIGERIDVGVVRERRCAGAMQAAMPRTARRGFVELGGEIDPSDARAARTIIVLDSAGAMRGYGLATRRSLAAILTAPEAPIKWVGYTRTQPGTREQYSAYLAGPNGVSCLIGAVSINAEPPRTQPASR
jgi:hypothetical protein